MKKILFILSVVLLSCEKEPSYCWDCYKDTLSSTGTTSNYVELCGLSEKEIGETIGENTYTINGVQYSMRCSKSTDDR